MNTDSQRNLLVLVESISYEASKCNLDFKNRIQDKASVNKVAEFLSITFEQAVLLSCIVELSLQRMVTLESFSRHFHCSVLKALTLFDEIESLEKRSYVKRQFRSVRKKPSYHDIGFTVPHKVIESLRKSDKTLLEPDTRMNLPNLLEQVKIAVKEREDESMTTRQLIDEVGDLLRSNQEHVFIQYLNQHLAKTENKCIAMVLAYFRLTGQFITEMDDIPNAVFDDIGDQLEFRRTMISGRNELVASGVISMQPTDFANQQVISLSKHAIEILYKEYPELFLQELQVNGLIKAGGIQAKQLYFHDGLEVQINNLVRLLSGRQFKSFQKAAQNKKISKGISAMFYGCSGTGKTEAVYQIARRTRRDIMMVDLSQTKSMWFGESEKQVQKIFDDYRQLLQTARTEPILFINEADGLFSKRFNLGTGGTSSSQTMNTIQNILLQALENFEGILIATTNLMENLDKAFERRFLFKMDFPKPDKTIRKRIWMDKLPELTPCMAEVLGERFELTGGQIDIQVRQLILRRVLDKKLNVFEVLLESCEKEKGFTERKRVGF